MKKTLILLFSFLTILIGAFFVYNNLSKDYQPHVEHISNNNSSDSSESNTTTMEETTATEEITPAADFTVYTKEGTAVNLSDFYGKPIVVNFWATWCGPCKMELPAFEKLYQKYKDEVTFLMVNLTDDADDTIEKVSAFVEENQYTFPVYHDVDMNAALTYYITSVPRTLFIDSNGNISYGYMGAMSEETLEMYIKEILDK